MRPRQSLKCGKAEVALSARLDLLIVFVGHFGLFGELLLRESGPFPKIPQPLKKPRENARSRHPTRIGDCSSSLHPVIGSVTFSVDGTRAIYRSIHRCIGMS